MQFSEHFQKAIRLIDEANSADPSKALWEGQSLPQALLYGQRMSLYLSRFDPDASEALHVAARAQHICRWQIPRDQFPMTKVGYHTWRNTLKKFHAAKAADILIEIGYEKAFITQVKDLLMKKNLKRNQESQTLEDVVCLVFLQFYMEDFAQHKTEAKMIDILRKTWGKMSAKGQAQALKLDLSDAVASIVHKALAT